MAPAQRHVPIWGASAGGGGDGVVPNFLSSFERAPINSDSTLGAFEVFEAGFPKALMQTAGVWNKRVFLVGGATNNVKDPPVATVVHGDIRADNGLLDTGTSGSLATARASQGSLVLGDFLYALGGRIPGTVRTATVERSAIDPVNGSLGSWEVVAPSLNAPRSLHSVALAGDLLFILGGSSSGRHHGASHRGELRAG